MHTHMHMHLRKLGRTAAEPMSPKDASLQARRSGRVLLDKNADSATALEKGRLLDGAAHALRTPLNAILGFTGTLRMELPGPINAEQDKQLRIVQTSARHLLALVNDLLDLASLDSQMLDLALEPVDCAQLLEEVTASLRPKAQHRALELTLRMTPQKCVLQTDRAALRQIVGNLLNNAIQSTSLGGVVLRLESFLTSHRPWVQISVEDTGGGMSLADQNQVFEAFTRMAAAEGRVFEGTGIGLHLSRGLARKLGGELSVRSLLGQGSTFVLELPMD